MEFRIPKQSFVLVSAFTLLLLACILLTLIFHSSYAARNALQKDLELVASLLIRERLEEVIARKASEGYEKLLAKYYFDEAFFGDYAPFARSTLITEVTPRDFRTPQAGSGYKRVEVTVSWGGKEKKSLSVATIVSHY